MNNLDNLEHLNADFIIEDITVKSLNGGIRKKFTSLATNGTLFRWQFGDTHQNPVIETTENPYYHSFREKGTYSVSHQSCLSCGLTQICSGWCTKDILVEAPPKPSIIPLVATAGFFFLIFPKKNCEDYDNIKDCNKHDCQWLEEEKKCVKKCAEGYRLEKVKTDKNKKPYKHECKLNKS